MRFLLFLGLLAGGVVATLPWANAWLDASGLRQDAASAPQVARSNSALRAGAIAHFMLKAAKERGAALTPEGLRIEVEAARKGALNLQGGALEVQGENAPATVSIQKATIHVQYDQPIYLGLTRRVEFTVEAEGIGDGGPSTFPSADEKEAGAAAE
ncbi:hypothetical protein [Hyalangium gracile]|uniref:hypothetical protein n=1 Tax=Hyalangium gracile TaxID=394092 RepID=UPI001CCB6355|nr:hypothetical protein [Hyalangium gracile]